MSLVAVTGYGQDCDRRRTEASGFEAHLTKPVDIQELARSSTRSRVWIAASSSCKLSREWRGPGRLVVPEDIGRVDARRAQRRQPPGNCSHQSQRESCDGHGRRVVGLEAEEQR